jgi:hypothetical protein
MQRQVVLQRIDRMKRFRALVARVTGLGVHLLVLQQLVLRRKRSRKVHRSERHLSVEALAAEGALEDLAMFVSGRVS